MDLITNSFLESKYVNKYILSLDSMYKSKYILSLDSMYKSK